MTQLAKREDARSVVDLSQGTVVATVEIAAPVERVFRAISSDEQVKWWGSADDYHATKWVGDLRVGGKWRSEGIGADGQPYAIGGEFVEIDPPRRLVHTWCAPWDGNRVTTVTYRLEPIAGGTRVTIRHEGFVGRPASCEEHGAGWTRVMGWLRNYLEQPSKEARA